MKHKNCFTTLVLFVAILFNGCKKDNDSPKVAPVASFSYSGAGVPAPATVTFTNNSTNATSYAWDFGDNGTSTEKDPQHTYTAGGVYTVQLTATGEGGTNSITKTVNIQNPSGPSVDFTFSGAGVPAPATVTFTNITTNATSYTWDFGDNGTSTDKDPQHTYTAGGVYAVQLTATGAGGTNSITKTVNIQNPTGPTAAFTFTGGGCQAPCIVSFTDVSTGATSWNWDFGDGQTSTQQNPTHTYTTGNNFNVQLSVSGPNGSNSTTKSVSILAPPTVCKISNISIITCPLTDGGGTSWDGFSAPDFYVNLETTSGTVLLDGSGSYNSDLSTFPQSWNISPTYNIPNTNWNTTYRIHIWEHDSPDPDDDVSFCNFMLNNYTTVGNHYPSQFTITNGTTQIKLTVQWQ